ncbi:LamG-like jellyroll fold domain-containing protein [Micromonospora sp. NBC_01813]|uniref:LamG-like jellyroll fold domain-containing protein n=1 Tax=Micromonospora sp. NBC_01813 TaxID=2975988 RepID=UPI002DD91E01|nr:LamG-like jellyroll fold domain-containing protein [Micromonospora sp. NBC_01813]WSA06143.1 ricin-type beta-trefoil lectin domain protein [Micromonospora sp. NBC_01813]
MAAVVVGLSSSVPPGAVPADGEFPVGWLSSWLTQRPGWLPWGGAAVELPTSRVGDGAGPGGYVAAAATRAAGGAGQAQRLVDGLPGYAGQPAVPESVTPVTAVRYDAATSRRDAGASRSTMTVYDNADGSTTAQLSTVQVNYQAEDGSWRPVDSTLVRRGDRWVVRESPLGLSLGATSEATDVATSEATDVATSGATDGAAAGPAAEPLVEFSLPGGGSMGWSLAGAAAVTPVVDGETATYPEVFPGTDLELVARPDGVKETLILASPQAGSEWVFPLTLDGVTARAGAGGSVELVDDAGSVVASIPPAFMEDSSVDAETGLPAQSAAVAMELTEVDGGPALRLVADRRWLTDPARVFPVRVDPTVTTGPDGDVFVDSDRTTYATVQNGNHLQVGYHGSVGSRTFLNFDISAALTDAKPIIASAYLRLYLNHRVRCDAKYLQVGLVEQDWTVDELATADPPGPDIEPGSVHYRYYTDNGQSCANPSAGPNTGQWVQVDVRDLISGWALGQRHLGLALIDDEQVLAAGARFTSANYGNGAYAPRLELTMTANLPPQVSQRSPVHGAVVSTLTPRLYVRGHDPDNSGTVSYRLWLHDDAGTVLRVFEGTGSYYDVPAGLLQSNKQYSWVVQPFDGTVYGARYPRYTFYTRVPQPALGSRLAQNPGVGYHPEIGNYTTTVTDAQVAGVGPELAITRSYNTLDTRRSGAFGQGWSSLLDAQVTGRTSTTAAVQSAEVTYPDGSQAAFGPTSDGSFVPPPGRYEVLTEVRSGTSVTGYRLTVKHGTTYVFGRSVGGGVFRLTAVTDANGRTLTATYNSSGLVSTLTNASGRSLTLTWAATASPSTGSHVTRVTTDAPTTGGSGYVWQYTYGSHDRLTQACTPTSACTTYGWGNAANQGANAVRNHAPSSYWRLNEPAGSTWAVSDMLERGGTDVAFYEGTTPGATPTVWPGSTSTSTAFNGTSSRVRLPSGLVNDSAYQSVSLWFRTAATSRAGVLFSYQHDPISGGTTSRNYTPAIYVGTSGKLHAKFYDGNAAGTMQSTGRVDDGQWHHVVLAGAGTSQALYLDGTRQASRDGLIEMFDIGGSAYEYVGAGFVGGSWPDQPHQGSANHTGHANFFTGQIADVAFFHRTLTAGDVTEINGTARAQSWQLSTVTSAEGRTLASLSTDPVTGKLATLTDGNGGTWTMGTPRVAGTSALYAAAVLGSAPTDYWRLRDAAGVDAVNETWQETATFSAVTLGAAGPFADGQAVSFDGTSSLVSVPGGRAAPTGPKSQELWFKTTATAGVLLGTQDAAVGGTPSAGSPVLWIDADGRLRGLAPSTEPTGPLTSGLADKCAELAADGTKVQVGTCAATSTQSWRYVGSSQQLRRGDKCLGLTGQATGNGTLVQAQTCSTSTNQRWTPHQGGWRNTGSGRCLEVPGSSTTNGTQLAIRSCATTQANQRWALALTSPSPVNDGKWHHAVLTTTNAADATTQVLYLDGVPVQSSTGALPATGPQGQGYLGAGYTGNGWSGLAAEATAYYAGSLAEVAFYDRALSTDEVTLHHRSVGQTVPLVVTAATGGGTEAPGLSETAAGQLPADTLPPGATQVDSAAQDTQTTTVANPVTIVSVTDPGGHQVSYSYDLVSGRKVSQTDALGRTTLYGYDTGGFTSLEYDPNGIVTRSVQDERGNTIQEVTCQDQTAQKCASSYYTYTFYSSDPTHPKSDRLTAVRGPGSSSAQDDTYRTLYFYDNYAGNLASTVDPVGRSTEIRYTNGATGLPAEVLDPSKGLQLLTYTSAGDVATVLDPVGATTSYTYDRLGRELTETVVTSSFPQGRTTTYTYDAMGRVATRTDPAVTNRVTGAVHTAVTQHAYSPDGLLTRQTVSDATGGDVTRVSEWSYDGHGRRSQAVDPMGDTTGYRYDVYGHVVEQTDPDGTVNAYQVDVNGNLLSRTLKGYTGDPNDPTGPVDLVVESNTYDPAGRLASTTDAMGHVTAYTYTDDGRTATVTRSDGDSSFLLESNSYDAAGNLVEQRTDNGQTVTTYAYDAAGRQIRSVLDPDGLHRVTDTTLSPGDQVLSSVARDGSGATLAVTDHAYDILGREVSQTRYRSTDRTTTPVARWRLDETSGTTAADSAGNSPGTATGVTWENDAQRGRVAVFTGASSSQITTAAPAVDTNRPYTVAAWVRVDNAGKSGPVLTMPGAARVGASSTYREFAFQLRFDHTIDGWRVSTNGQQIASITRCNCPFGEGTVGEEQWQHLAVGVDPQADKFTMFIDGDKVGESAGARYHSTAMDGLRIGSGFDGAISDLQLYQGVSADAGWAARVVAGTVPAPDAGISRTSHVLDNGGLATAVLDPLGNTTNVAYDEADRPAVTTGPQVQAETGELDAPVVTARPVERIGYNAFGEVAAESDPNGNVTRYAYDRAGRPYETRLPAYTPPGGSTPVTPVATAAYDSLGQVVSQTDPLGRVTEFTYDQLGRAVTQVAPDDAATTARYDLAGNLLAVTDPTGAVTGSSYDLLGRTTSVSEAVRQTGQTHTTTMAYDSAGRLSAVTTPAGVTAGYGYNAVGELTSVVDGAGQTSSVGYDALGRPVRETNPDGTYSVTAYDPLSQPTATAAYRAAGGTALATSAWTYDAAGNAVSATDARGTTTRFGYDATGLLRTQSEPVNATTTIESSYGYDLAGNPTRFTDGRGQAFRTTYNVWGLPQSVIEPSTAAYPNAADRTYTTGYDVAGQPVSQRAPGGVTRTLVYDDAGRLVRQSGAGAEATTQDRTYGYDAAGRLVEFSGSGGTNRVAYDDRGLPLSVTGPSGDAAFTYTPDGSMASRDDEAGLTQYGYDGAGRLASLSNSTAGVSVGYAYDEMSAVSSMSYGGTNNRRVFAYDDLHRLTSDRLVRANGQILGTITYGWDANGNETSKTVTRGSTTVSNTYTYDLADRLTSWNNGNTTVGYRYDAAGNRTGVGDVDYVHDARNRLVSDSTGTSYRYTARGTRRQTVTGSTTATGVADAFDQIVSQQPTGGGNAREYTYDALGRALRSDFRYTGLGNDLAKDGAATYLRDPDGGAVAVRTGSTSRMVWTDLHDDIVAQFNTAGTSLTGNRTYSPLGEVTATSTMEGNLGYQSEWTDPRSGRVNMHARWYDPAVGQFDSRDSVTVSGVPDSIRANRYQYGDGNSLTVTDPTGHFGKRLRNAWKKISSGVQKAWNTVKAGVQQAWEQVSEWAQAAREQIVEKFNDVKQAVSQAYQKMAEAVRGAVDQVGQWARTARDWIVEHKADIVGALVGFVVEAACMVAIGWTGVGAVACGVASGVTGALVTGAMQGQTGVELLRSAVLGGVVGGLGAALPMMGPAAGKALSKAGSAGAKKVAGTGVGKAAASAGRAVASAGKAVGRKVDDVSRAVSRGTSRATREAADYADDAARAGGGRVDDLAGAAASCVRHSFAPDTRVQMADGTTKPIAEVELDDEVLATDPATGQTTARPVRVLHGHADRELTDVTVTDTDSGESTVIETTAHHPFWNADTGRWTDAADLRPGDLLRSPDGETTQRVAAVRVWTGLKWMNDLTVAGVHTYYVVAGDQPVLVHNCDMTDLYHGTSREAAANIRRSGVDPNFSNRSKMDFGKGFYTTRSKQQAQKWANNPRFKGDGAVLHFKVPTAKLDALPTKKFTENSPDLAGTVRHYRTGARGNPLGRYQMVEGPMLMNVDGFGRGAAPVWSGNQVVFYGKDAGQILTDALQR